MLRGYQQLEQVELLLIVRRIAISLMLRVLRVGVFGIGGRSSSLVDSSLLYFKCVVVCVNKRVVQTEQRKDVSRRCYA